LVYEPSGQVPIPVWQVVGGDIAAHKARIVSPCQQERAQMAKI
jgi:hypothetical protein